MLARTLKRLAPRTQPPAPARAAQPNTSVRQPEAPAAPPGFDESSLALARTRLRAPELLELLSYWEAKRGSRPMPARADIDPIDLPRHLSRLVLADVLHDPLRFRFRIVGTEHESRLGYSLKGHILTADAGAFYKPYAACATHVRTTREFVSFDFGDSDPGTFERLLLPLSSDGRQVDMILGEAIYDNLQTSEDQWPAPPGEPL